MIIPGVTLIAAGSDRQIGIVWTKLQKVMGK
jgi:hypothetical protein